MQDIPGSLIRLLRGQVAISHRLRERLGDDRTPAARARLAVWRGLGQRGRLDASLSMTVGLGMSDFTGLRETLGASRYAPGMTD